MTKATTNFTSEPQPARYAVVGNPVAHSQSPFIHAEFARQTGESVSYERVFCEMDAFATTLQRFAAAGASGCNVTLPFKFEAFDLCAKRSPRAELAGACNTIRFDATGWHGDNTDGAGLLRDIERNAGVRLDGARVLLIGAGGAAAGALGPLVASGAAEVIVANRSIERAQRLVARHAQAAVVTATTPLKSATPTTHVAATSLEACGGGFDVVINASASSVGGAAVPVARSVLRPGALAVDMMYGAPAQAFLAWAEGEGAVARDGLGMLVEQAAEAFEIWRGVAPDTAPVLAALRLRLASP
ncbi:MAG: shikimate dehydrogenase [Caldimonas sp.]